MLIHAGPGAGKTLGALLAFQMMQSEGRLQRALIFCHRTSILSQWRGAAAKLGLRLDLWNGPGSASDDADGWLLSYIDGTPAIKNSRAGRWSG